MFAILAAAASLAATQQEAPKVVIYSAPPGRSCGYWKARPVREGLIKPKVDHLGDLPPAHHELTVLRTDENGCSKAVVVRENVNGDGRFAKNR
jgi:hypothetical protein